MIPTFGTLKRSGKAASWMPDRNVKALFIEPMLLLRAEKLSEGGVWSYELKLEIGPRTVICGIPVLSGCVMAGRCRTWCVSTKIKLCPGTAKSL